MEHPWGAGHPFMAGFNLLPSSSAQVLICVRWRGKLLGALEWVVLREPPKPRFLSLVRSWGWHLSGGTYVPLDHPIHVAAWYGKEGPGCLGRPEFNKLLICLFNNVCTAWCVNEAFHNNTVVYVFVQRASDVIWVIRGPVVATHRTQSSAKLKCTH